MPSTREEVFDLLDALWTLCDEDDSIVEPWRDTIRAELTRLYAIEDAADVLSRAILDGKEG